MNTVRFFNPPCVFTVYITNNDNDDDDDDDDNNSNSKNFINKKNQVS